MADAAPIGGEGAASRPARITLAAPSPTLSGVCWRLRHRGRAPLYSRRDLLLHNRLRVFCRWCHGGSACPRARALQEAPRFHRDELLGQQRKLMSRLFRPCCSTCMLYGQSVSRGRHVLYHGFRVHIADFHRVIGGRWGIRGRRGGGRGGIEAPDV